MKKKVAILVPSLRGGGAERVIVNIVRYLNHEKFDVKLIVLKKEGPYVSLLPQNLDVIDLNTYRVRNSLFKLIRELNNFKPDVIFSTHYHLNLALLAIKKFLRGTPKLIIREANTPSKVLNELTKTKREILTNLYKKLYPKSDLIIAQCKDMKEDIINTLEIDDKKVKYIYNPLDIEKINESKEGENPYKAGNINLLSVGRLAHQKGFDNLLDAFKIVANKIPESHLTILGEGNLKSALNEQAVALGISDKLTFASFKGNPYPYYYYADTYILSSRWEGFPNTLLEALACGTKVVATNCKSGPKEILGEDEFGILVEEGNHNAMAAGILRSITEENRTKDRAEYFSIKKIVKEYEEVLSLT